MEEMNVWEGVDKFKIVKIQSVQVSSSKNMMEVWTGVHEWWVLRFHFGLSRINLLVSTIILPDSK